MWRATMFLATRTVCQNLYETSASLSECPLAHHVPSVLAVSDFDTVQNALLCTWCGTQNMLPGSHYLQRRAVRSQPAPPPPHNRPQSLPSRPSPTNSTHHRAILVKRQNACLSKTASRLILAPSPALAWASVLRQSDNKFTTQNMYLYKNQPTRK